jgi:hypothetical protein
MGYGNTSRSQETDLGTFLYRQISPASSLYALVEQRFAILSLAQDVPWEHSNHLIPVAGH